MSGVNHNNDREFPKETIQQEWTKNVFKFNFLFTLNS